MSQSVVDIAEIPYAMSLKVRAEVVNEELRFCLPADERFMGNPMIRAFHGGIINGFLNCVMRLNAMQIAELLEPPQLVSMTTGYLRSAHIAGDLYASSTINRLGKRIVSVSARAWQISEQVPERLVAQATASLQISPGSKK